MRNALVIGGNGFIGSHLVDSLVGDQWNVAVIDKFNRKFSRIPEGVNFIQTDIDHSITEIEKVFEAIAPHVVFYLAWKTLPETSMKNPVRDIGINLTPSLNLISVCAKAGTKLVFTSSGGAVYGATNQPHISETHETSPISPYGIEKLMVEKYLSMYRYLHGLDYVAIRPSTPFGPWQDYMGKQGAVAVFLYRVASGLPVTLWGDGSIIRDYFYISDLVDAMIKCADHPLHDGRRVFNVGGGEGVSLIQLLNWIEEIVERKAIIEQYPMRKFDPKTIVLDTQLIRNELGWSPKVSLPEGLKRTWKWMSGLI
ncbi:MAG: NAD-dependent epimerase/dehydratase family protein [Chloroflexi bacterium]|nr:NAD-dependent epimerase/dehydratase family protein [Chloroflexota bacterium]